MRRLDLIVIDLVFVATATLCALILRDNFDVSQERLASLLPYLVSTLIVAAGVIPAMGMNRSVWRFTSLADCLKILVATLAIVLGAVGLGFSINRLEGVARALPILQGVLISFALIGVRVLMRLRHLVRDRRRQQATPSLAAGGETVLVVGSGKLAELFLQSVADLAPDRVRIAGVLGRTDRHTGRIMRGHSILGTPQQIAGVLRDLEVHGVLVDRVVVCTAYESLPLLAQRALLEVERTTEIVVDFLAERMGLAAKNRQRRSAPSSKLVPVEDCTSGATREKRP